MWRIKRFVSNELAIGVVAGVLLAGVGSAKDTATGSWQALSGLRAGQKIVVVDHEGTRHRGRFRAVSEDSLTIRRKGREISIRSGEVVQVGVRDRSKRWRNVAIVAAVGAGVGLGIAAGVLSSGSGSDAAVEFVTASALIGAGAGGALGAAMGSYRTVYRQTDRSSGTSPPVVGEPREVRLNSPRAGRTSLEPSRSRSR